MSPENGNFSDDNHRKENNHYQKEDDYHNDKQEDKGRKDDFFSDDDFEFVDYDNEKDTSPGYRSRRIKERRRKKKMIFSIILIMLILVVIAAGIVFGYKFIKNKFFSHEEISEEERISIPQSLQLDQDINIMIAGARENLDEPEINSILFSSYNSSREELISLSIPVKTLMEIPGFELNSVDKSAVYGGIDLLSLTLGRGLGMEVDHYILMDIYSIVNKLNGIELKLDEPITIRRSDNSVEELKGGVNLINGETAVDFLLYFSGIESDVSIEDIVNQKLLLDTLIDKIAGENGEDLISNLTLIEKDYIETDLSLEELSKLISTFSRLDADKNKVYVLDVSPVELEGNIFYVPDISRVSEIFKQEEAASEEEAAGETVSLAILNGVGTAGLASKVSDIFNSLKYENGKDKYSIDRENIGNADNFNYNTTEIIVNSDEAYVMAAAEEIKDVLKVGSISTRENTEAAADIIIVLGHDYSYESLEAEETEESDEIIKINILNGEGTSKLAATAGELIEEHFNAQEKVLEVVETKDADNWNYTQTEIIIFTSRKGVEEAAQQIQDFLGVGIIKSSQDNVDNVDINVILGSDYTNK